ncbi:MAG: anthranilate synthase component I [Polyangiaceae bacterium]|nr:anthranilate synthase component I [Polyangiaceae bacterium]
MSRIERGTALVVGRRVGPCPDAFELFRSIAREHPDEALLFETGESVGGAPLHLVVTKAAAKIRSQGRRVKVVACDADGSGLVEHLAERFATYVVERAAAPVATLDLQFPPPPPDDDPEEELRAPHPLDVIRAATFGIRTSGYPDRFALFAAGVVEHGGDFEMTIPACSIVVGPATTTVLAVAFGSDDAASAARGARAAEARLERAVASIERLASDPVDVARGAVRLGGAMRPVDAEADLDDAAFASLVDRLKAHIVAGDVFQIVPSRTFRAPCADPLAAYAALRKAAPTPYQFFVPLASGVLLGASPEASVRVRSERAGAPPAIEVCPIAGTRRRGATPDEDDRLELELRLDEKELAEHVMLVDLARNDVARVAEPGTRRVTELMHVERFARVMHLCSTVAGVLRGDLDALHAFVACTPPGTLVGAPKRRAVEILGELETRRGVYGGAVGYVTSGGELDMAIVIRSALVRDGVASVLAGAGVVAASDPVRETDETRRKASALLEVLAATGGAS